MVTIRLRVKGKTLASTAKVVCPVAWSKSRFLSYCRREHPAETVVILDWPSGTWPWDERTVWMVHPDELSHNPG